MIYSSILIATLALSTPAEACGMRMPQGKSLAVALADLEADAPEEKVAEAAVADAKPGQPSPRPDQAVQTVEPASKASEPVRGAAIEAKAAAAAVKSS